MGHVFGIICSGVRDWNIIKYVIQDLDFLSLTFVIDGYDWRYYLEKNKKIKSDQKKELIKTYYSKLRELNDVDKVPSISSFGSSSSFYEYYSDDENEVTEIKAVKS